MMVGLMLHCLALMDYFIVETDKDGGYALIPRLQAQPLYDAIVSLADTNAQASYKILIQCAAHKLDYYWAVTPRAIAAPAYVLADRMASKA